MTDQLQEIRRSFASYKNGVISESMRQKGIVYHVNWGVSLTDLQQLATHYTPSLSLALKLWHDDVRECKIMALLLMPPAEVDGEVMQELIDGITTQELAELAAFLLLQHVPQSVHQALRCLAQNNRWVQLAGLHTMTRLLRQRQQLTIAQQHELRDQAECLLQTTDNLPISIRKAASNCLAELDENTPQPERKEMPK